VPNAALRFTPPSAGTADRGTGGGKPAKAKGAEAPGGTGKGAPPSRIVWKQGLAGDLEPVSVKTGISDGVVTEILSEELPEGASIVVGVERPKGEKGGSDLPPGFGSGGQKGSSRNRGI
jgi:HlyD family secretion protein